MRSLRLLVLCALAPFAAFAQEAQTNPPPVTDGGYAVSVETIETQGARSGLMYSGASAGGYAYVARTSSMSTTILVRERHSVTYNFRFNHGDARVFEGACRIRSEGRSLFGVEWNQRSAQLYSCEVQDQPAEQYALDVAVPAFTSGGISVGGVSIGAEAEVNEATQAILHARMVYEGASYEAAPTGFGRDTMFSRRVVTGYLISRDGHPVGRIDFRNNSLDRATITLPAADTDGREAVLFMALALQGMPDLYSTGTRTEVLDR